ncbi:MAG: PEP-CTERM sorting domain-containing protein [Nitrosospira sp.]
MNRIRHTLIAIVGSMGVGLSQAAIAVDDTAPVTAAATIDWSQLKLSVTGVNDTVPTVSYTNQNTSLSSNAWSPGQSENNSKSINNWTATSETNADAGITHANALASPLSLSGNATSMSGSSTSSGNRTVNFSVDGPGVLTVTVPYTISLTGDTSGCYYCYNYDHASVNGNADFYSYANHGSSSSNSNASFSLNNYYWDHSPQSQSGTLVFGIFASGAGNGSLQVNFDLSAQGASMVPEPESYAMLLAGLGLMGAVIRRRSVNRNV